MKACCARCCSGPLGLLAGDDLAIFVSKRHSSRIRRLILTVAGGRPRGKSD